MTLYKNIVIDFFKEYLIDPIESLTLQNTSPAQSF